MRALALVGLLLGAIAPGFAGSDETLLYDRGASGLWRKLLELQTAASLLHTTAHPDDEHGGTLTRLARGEGVRVALLSLTRGEAGANAIGPELFDGLGWIRAEELRLSGRYYGLERLYFTRLADYGYSKRLEEAKETWGLDAALADVVYLLRKERPLVVVSRFRGDARDGHGQHQFAGLVTREAFRAAADPERFPEQVASGLRPWSPLKLYAGGAREHEAWSVAYDAGVYSPWLGDSFENVARTGLSLQRSQTSGRMRRVHGSFVRYYELVESRVPTPAREASFFDGIDTSLAGIATLSGAPESAREELVAIESFAREAKEGFEPSRPEATAPLLVRGLAATRQLLEKTEQKELARLLREKEAQFSEAISLALGVELEATAVPPGALETSGSSFAPAPAMGPAVPGGELEVEVSLSHGAREVPLRVRGLSVSVPEGTTVEGDRGGQLLAPGEALARRLRVELSPDAPVWRPHVVRDSIAESRYRGGEGWWRAAPPEVASVEVELEIGHVVLTVSAPVRRWESREPYGRVRRELPVLPATSVKIAPELAVLPTGSSRELRFDVSVTRHGPGDGRRGRLALELPPDFAVEPKEHVIEALRSGETSTFSFLVRPPPGPRPLDAWIPAVLRAGGRSYAQTYQPIEHRDLETRYRVVPAASRILALDLAVPRRLRVGYVMGAGDGVPRAIEQLGASVHLLSAEELRSGSLGELDTIVIGTRAYAVREDLRKYHGRLLDYVERGGNLVVLYNTYELDPSRYAPFPGELTPEAEEISEESAPVEILDPEERVFVWPNRISERDFEGWVEQRGSKFWSSWDEAYVPMVVSADTGQSPQRGGWLQCRYGEGTYTYFAYALHRQLPEGVPGAYRILANLVSLGRSD